MISDSKLLASAAWDAQSLNELKAKAGEDPAANIRPVARQVEGMFVQMMLKSMRDALPKDGLFSSEHTRLYTSMYDQQIAQQMTAGKGLGLAEMMVKQMTPEQPLPEESTPAAPMKFPLETVVRYQNQALSQLVQKAVPRNYDDSLPGDSKAFLAQLSLPAQLLEWGICGMWVAFLLDENIRGAIFVRRWYSMKWTTKGFVAKH